MNLDKRNLILALNNAGLLSIQILIVLYLVSDTISSHTAGISIGYAFLCFITEFPLFYLSFTKGWNQGDASLLKRMYLPVLSFVCLFILSVVYTSFAYGYNPIDYFYTSNGEINSFQLMHHLKFTLTGVILVFANQITGSINEREIIINPSSELHMESRLLTVHGNNKNETFEMQSNNILYAVSEGNYIKIICRGEEYSLRMTLKEFQEAVKDFPELVRCHRAYIANIKNVCRYEGNSRKGYIFFNESRLSIPVSQSYSTQIKTIMQNR